MHRVSSSLRIPVSPVSMIGSAACSLTRRAPSSTDVTITGATAAY